MAEAWVDFECFISLLTYIKVAGFSDIYFFECQLRNSVGVFALYLEYLGLKVKEKFSMNHFFDFILSSCVRKSFILL